MPASSGTVEKFDLNNVRVAAGILSLVSLEAELHLEVVPPQCTAKDMCKVNLVIMGVNIDRS